MFLADLQDKIGSTLTLNINIEETLTVTDKNHKIKLFTRLLTFETSIFTETNQHIQNQ